MFHLPDAIIQCKNIKEVVDLIQETHSDEDFLRSWKHSYQGKTCFRLTNGHISGYGEKDWYISKGEPVIPYATYAKENNFNVLRILDTLSQSDRYELFGCLIDVVEDFLSEKGITAYDIPNEEREDSGEDAALIYGSDYDKLANRFAEVLGISRWTEEDVQDKTPPSLGR